MRGTIKDILHITGVQGYIIVTEKNIQIKLPSKHKLARAKDRIRRLYNDLADEKQRPGNVVEIYLKDMIVTVFMNKTTMLLVLSSQRVNLALLRMTGKLTLSNIVKEK